MPRVTVNKDSSAVTPLPSPTPAPARNSPQPEPLPDVPLTDQQADAPPPVEPARPLRRSSRSSARSRPS